MTPQEMLEAAPVHSVRETAIILRLLCRNGDPNRRAVHELVRRGAVRIIDPEQPIHRWCVSSAEINRYITDGPRTGAEIVELRGVS